MVGRRTRRNSHEETRLMARGGKREGAGRIAALDDVFARLAIGGRCEGLWREAYSQKLAETQAQLTVGVSKLWQTARDVPIAERQQRQKKQWAPVSEDYQDSIDSALREDLRVDASDANEPNRLLTVATKRPRGPAMDIIRFIAQDETAKRGIKISTHMVKRCWAEFRELEEGLKA